MEKKSLKTTSQNVLEVGELVSLFKAELLKLKRSKMFFISLIGAAVAPVMWLITHYSYSLQHPETIIYAEKAFKDINMFITLLIGILLYGVITSYLFNREYTENTLKSILVIPISRTHLIISKSALLCGWLILLSLFAWGITALLCLIFSFKGMSLLVLIRSLVLYILSGFLMALLMTPVMFVALVYKNFVPTIVFTIAVVMFNVLVAGSDYISFFPWSAVYAIVSGDPGLKYPLFYSYLSIGATGVIGLGLCIYYFENTDVL